MDPHVRQIDIHFINWNAQNPVLIDRIEIICEEWNKSWEGRGFKTSGKIMILMNKNVHPLSKLKGTIIIEGNAYPIDLSQDKVLLELDANFRSISKIIYNPKRSIKRLTI